MSIDYNKEGCNSEEEVLDACDPSHANLEKLKEISIYPNPTQGQVSIDFNDTDPGLIYLNLTDLSGKLIKSWVRDIAEDKMKLTMSEIPAGTYFLNLISNGQVWHYKILLLN